MKCVACYLLFSTYAEHRAVRVLTFLTSGQPIVNKYGCFSDNDTHKFAMSMANSLIWIVTGAKPLFWMYPIVALGPLLSL